LSLGSYNPNARTPPADLVVDKFFHLTSKQGDHAFILYFGGATLRNGVLVVDDVATEARRATSDFIRLGAPTSGDGAFANDAKHNPVRVHNLTLVDLRGRDNLVGNNGVQQAFGTQINAADAFADLQVGNLLAYVPNAPTQILDDAPLETSAGTAPAYSGRRIWNEVDFDYGSATNRFGFQANVTGTVSGATGRVLTMTEPSGGSFGTNDASGKLSIEVQSGTFVVGDVLTEGDTQANLTAINTASGGPISRFGNSTAATATFAPINDPGGLGVSAAIGDTDATAPVALDDFHGNLRGVAPSRGAIEPS
jgi:hypothetical protein